MAVDFVVDLQWGSTGKGKVAYSLARRNRYEIASTSNGPNAGHTTEHDGRRVVFKTLPSAALETKRAFVSAAAVFDAHRLNTEAEENQIDVYVHPRAMVLNPKHSRTERACLRGIASTMQGTAAALTEKLMRGPDVSLAKEVLPKRSGRVVVLSEDDVRDLRRDLCRLETLHEVSQGFQLSIDHGSHYPQCTSRNCTVGAALDQLGLPPSAVGNVYGVFRPYPIRVGNLPDGHSGGWWGQDRELSWEEVFERARVPPEMWQEWAYAEMTTVTKRLRRVGEFSVEPLREAIWTNGVTALILNFAQYVDFDAWHVNQYQALPGVVHDFVRLVQSAVGVPVVAVGTGADEEDLCWRDS